MPAELGGGARAPPADADEWSPFRRVVGGGTMSTDPVEANLELVLDWIDALRRSDVDSIAERFHPDVAWEDVAGSVACYGREQILAWLRASPSHPHQVDALELVASRD